MQGVERPSQSPVAWLEGANVDQTKQALESLSRTNLLVFLILGVLPNTTLSLDAQLAFGSLVGLHKLCLFSRFLASS